MVGDRQRLVIIGDGETAELAFDYFTRDTNYQVVGFSAERQFMRHHSLFQLPVVPFEEIESYFDPRTHRAFAAVSFTQLNRLRSRLYCAGKAKGYSFCSYISQRAYVGTETEIGENCFVLDNVVVQHGARIGNNVTLWIGSVVGHRTIVRDNCFVASHVAISGFCDVGENSFLGVNSCLVGNTKVARDCIIGAGAVIVNDTGEGRVYIGNPGKPIPNKHVGSFISGKETI